MLLFRSAEKPSAVLSLPLKLSESASDPVAVLRVPGPLLKSASKPSAVLLLAALFASLVLLLKSAFAPGGGIARGVGILIEGVKASGGVGVGKVVEECCRTGGSIVAAVVAQECVKTGGCVIGAARIIEERQIADGPCCRCRS